jgi:hypothetical protein
MNEIEHEGKTYILKSQIESIIKERVGKVAQRATIAEEALAQAESRLEKAEKAMSSVDILNQQISDMQTKLNTAEQRFQRYQSISKHGLTDPDLIEAIEWSYERAQKGVSEKDRLTLSDWLDSQVENPDKAPLTIRPHLRALREVVTSTEETPVSQEVNTQAQLAELERATPPRTNSGAIPAPDTPGFLDRALRDPEFYEANRDKVIEAWRHRQRRQG